jgi:peroxiredoxin
MDRRLGSLILAGVIVAALTYYGESRQAALRALPPAARPVPRRQAPSFQLYDQHKPSQLVKFERYLGRTKLALIFFDGELGLQGDPLVRRALELAPEIARHGTQLVAVSLATPAANRQALQQLHLDRAPFPILTDVDLHGPVNVPAHRAYGLFDERTGKLSTGLFLIDRKQTVAMNTANGLPLPVTDPASVLQELAAGAWPGNQ